MNNVNLIGTLTKDIELKYLPSGQALGNLSIAVNQDYKDKNGQKVEKVSFFDVSVFGKQAETINSFFRKGSRIGISGELEQQRWKTQDGDNKSKVVIKLQSFTFIDKKSDNQSNNSQTNQQYQAPQPTYQNAQGQQQYQQQQQAPQQPPAIDINDDEIPF